MTGRTRHTDSIKSLAKRIRPVDEVDPYIKVLVYGPNGSGKTRFAATAPKVLIIDTNERGTRSAIGSGARKVELESWEELADAYWLLKSGKHPFESVAIDSITGLQALCMDFVLAEKERRDPTVERSQPTMRNFGRTGKLMGGMLLAFRNLPLHVIFTAKDRQVRNDETGMIEEITVELPAGPRGTAMDSVGVIGAMEPKRAREGTKRVWVDRMITSKHPVYRTKDRTNRLGTVVRPTVPLVIQAWNNDPKEPNNG